MFYRLCNRKEVARYRKNDTNLSVNIWIEESKKVMFQINYNERVDKKKSAVVSLIDNSVKKKCKVSEETIREVENFCKNNNFALCLISECVLSESDFFSVMIKGGDVKKEEEIKDAKVKTQSLIRKGIEEKRYDDDKELLKLAQKALEM